jgi:hypothetical protein
MFPDQRFSGPNLAVVQAIILRQFDARFKPKLRLPIGAIYVYVHPQFFAREEKEPESVFTKDRWAQDHFPTALNVSVQRRARDDL